MLEIPCWDTAYEAWACGVLQVDQQNILLFSDLVTYATLSALILIVNAIIWRNLLKSCILITKRYLMQFPYIITSFYTQFMTQ